jgi:hypothetical protein
MLIKDSTAGLTDALRAILLIVAITVRLTAQHTGARLFITDLTTPRASAAVRLYATPLNALTHDQIAAQTTILASITLFIFDTALIDLSPCRLAADT